MGEHGDMCDAAASAFNYLAKPNGIIGQWARL